MSAQDFYKAIGQARAALESVSKLGVAAEFKANGAENALDEAIEEVEQAAQGAEVLTDSGHALRFWDDGSGPLWVYIESTGPVGVVRADTWESAFECCQDEIMHGSTFAEMVEECGLSAEDIEEIEDGGSLPDGYQYRSNGEPSNEGIHGELCCEDINGCSLELLTPALAEALKLTVNVRFEVK